MSDDRSPTDRGPIDDDIVSAVLDDEATPDERALVESSPDGRRRLAELRAAAAAVGEPVTPLSPGAADGMVARALAGAATPVVVGTGPPPEPAHDEVAARRRRRSAPGAWRRTLGAVAAVAAVVVLVAGAAALVRAAGSRSSDSASSSGSTSDRATSEAAAPATGQRPPDLGSLDAAETVLDRYALLVGTDLSVEHPSEASPSMSGGSTSDEAAPMAPPLGCPVPPVTPAAGERWSVTADATLPGGPVLVMSNGLAPGANRVLVVDATTCAVLAERTI